MARLVVQCAAAVAFLAMALQYTEFAPQLPGVGLLAQWLSSGKGSGGGTINVDKLLEDLNSGLPRAGGDDSGGAEHSGDGGQGPGPLERATSAALSVMYLASMPGLKQQVTQAPGVLEVLLRHVMAAELTDMRQALLQSHSLDAQQRRVHGQRAELLSSALLAVAKLATGDRQLQGQLLGAEAGAAAAAAADNVVGTQRRGSGSQRTSVSPAVLGEGELLSRVEELLGSGVPAWQAAASVLLHALAGEHLNHPVVGAWVAVRAESMAGVAVALLEAGAHFNSTDVAVSGAQLLELLAARDEARQQLAASRALGVAAQVLVTWAGGGNSSSGLVGATAKMLQRIITSTAAAAAAAGGLGAQASAGGGRGRADLGGEVARDLFRKGIIAPLIREVRLGHRASLGPSLGLLLGLMVRISEEQGAEQAADWKGKGEEVQGGTGEEDAAASAVGSGILSLCAQLLFKAGGDAEARDHCSAIIRLLLARSASKETATDGTADTGKGAEWEGAAQQSADAGEAPQPYRDSQQGWAALAADLLQIMRSTPHPDLHVAVLEALRDVAPARAAAEALVRGGAVPHLALILAHNATQEVEKGTDHSEIAWLLHSQRSAAAVVALLGLQDPLRERLVRDGALHAVAASLVCSSQRQQQQTGMVVQMRVTAAAALVPLLGTDGRYDQIAIAAGVLEPLVKMHRGGNTQEQQAAGRVLRLLARNAVATAAYEHAGVRL